jgi:hypothetical protein
MDGATLRSSLSAFVMAWLDGVLPDSVLVILASQADLRNSSANFALKGDGIRLKITY